MAHTLLHIHQHWFTTGTRFANCIPTLLVHWVVIIRALTKFAIRVNVANFVQTLFTTNSRFFSGGWFHRSWTGTSEEIPLFSCPTPNYPNNHFSIHPFGTTMDHSGHKYSQDFSWTRRIHGCGGAPAAEIAYNERHPLCTSWGWLGDCVANILATTLGWDSRMDERPPPVQKRSSRYTELTLLLLLLLHGACVFGHDSNMHTDELGGSVFCIPC